MNVYMYINTRAQNIIEGGVIQYEHRTHDMHQTPKQQLAVVCVCTPFCVCVCTIHTKAYSDTRINSRVESYNPGHKIKY